MLQRQFPERAVSYNRQLERGSLITKVTMRFRNSLIPSFIAILASTLTVAAVPIAVPNGSFESPATTFVNTHIDFWQKTAQPPWYDPSGGFTWEQLTGVFKNTDVTSADHIDNCDGAQAMWMFAVPDVGIFQDYESMDWSHTNAPLHAFGPTFDIGKAYEVTVGVIGTGGGMLPGATIEMRFYYRDSQSNLVTFASLAITNLPTTFSNNTHLIDFQLRIPPVRSSDPWAGQHVGIELISTVDTNLQGGYWDLDNVRLSIRNPLLLNPVWTNGQFQFTLKSDPGMKFQILAADDPLLPASNWSTVGTVTNTSGTVSFTDVSARPGKRFYQAVEVP